MTANGTRIDSRSTSTGSRSRSRSTKVPSNGLTSATPLTSTPRGAPTAITSRAARFQEQRILASQQHRQRLKEYGEPFSDKMARTGYSCIRHTLCCLNLIFWLFGCAILGVGIWLSISYDTYSRILPSYHILSADNMAIAAGTIMFCIGFCGCCGAWFQSKCLLGTFMGLVVLVMLLEIAAGTLGFAFRKYLGDTLKEELLEGIKYKYSINNTYGLQTTWDSLQDNLDCCGVISYKDWYNIDAWPQQQLVPQSCCIPPSSFSSNSSTTSSNSSSSEDLTMINDGPIQQNHRPSLGPFTMLFTGPPITSQATLITDTCPSGYRPHGCYRRIRSWLLRHLHIVAMSCTIFAFVQFFAIVSALLIICTMDFKKRYRPVNQNGRPTYSRVPTL